MQEPTSDQLAIQGRLFKDPEDTEYPDTVFKIREAPNGVFFDKTIASSSPSGQADRGIVVIYYNHDQYGDVDPDREEANFCQPYNELMTCIQWQT